ncbi:MAG: hypothetical protein H7X99_07475 [Saprospiraceae bacterium]|nr:hypothetical protein [Saprospiraceae bacterium]
MKKPLTAVWGWVSRLDKKRQKKTLTPNVPTMIELKQINIKHNAHILVFFHLQCLHHQCTDQMKALGQ